MPRRLARIVIPLLLVLCGLFLWWYNRPPSIQDFSVSPEIINVGQEATIRVVARGAQRLEARIDQGEFRQFAPTNVPGEFKATFAIRDPKVAKAKLYIAAFRGWWGRAEFSKAISINRPPRVQDRVIVLKGPGPVSFKVEATDPDGDSCTYSINLEPSYGLLNNTAAHASDFTYEPGPEFNGYDSFLVLVEDKKGGRATARVEVVQPPDYFGSYQRISEIFQAPLTDIYGSTVSLWQFAYPEDLFPWQGVPPTRVPMSVITGHAEQLTCQQASAAAATAWLMLPPDEDNGLTAGFGQLDVATINDIQTLSEEAYAPMLELRRSFGFLQDLTGLVQVHFLDFEKYNTATKLIQHYASTFSGQETSVIRLRIESETPAIPVVVPFFFLGDPSGNYLEITMSAESIMSESFKALREVHLQRLEKEMLAEKRRLRDTYRRWAEEDRREKEYLQRMEAEKGSKWMEENGYWARWTRDYKTGKVVPLDPPQWTSYAARLEELPDAIELSEELARQMEELLEELSQLLKTGRLQALNDAILIDSFLRGWELPFELKEDRILYDKWLETRGQVWAEIYKQLIERGVTLEAISHGNIIFKTYINAEKGVIYIVPYYVLDAADCGLLLKPGAGVIQYFNWWEKRELKPAFSSDEELPKEAKQFFEKGRAALEGGQIEQANRYFLQAQWEAARPTFDEGYKVLNEGNAERATQYLREAMTIAPLGTAAELLKLWWDTYPDTATIYRSVRTEAYEVVNTALRIAQALNKGKGEAELLLTVWDYLHRPDLLKTIALVFDLLDQLIDRMGSSASRACTLAHSITEAQEQGVNPEHLTRLLNSIASSYDAFISDVQEYAEQHGLTMCLPSFENYNTLDPGCFQLLQAIQDKSLRGSFQKYLQSSHKLYLLTRDSGRLTTILCVQFRNQISSELRDLRHQLKVALDIPQWESVQPSVEKLMDRIDTASPVDLAVWEQVIAERLFRLALDTKETGGQYALEASKLAEEAASRGLRSGVVEPLATWLEMEWRSGLYREALAALLAPERPLILLSPDLSFSVLNKQVVTGDELAVKQQGDSLIVQALPNNIDVLKIAGFRTEEDRKALQQKMEGLPCGPLLQLGGANLADDILAYSSSLLSSTERLRQVIARLDPLFIKSLAYGWYISDELMPMRPRASSFLPPHLSWRDEHGSNFLDESHYLPSLLTVKSLEELARLPRAIIVDPDDAFARLVGQPPPSAISSTITVKGSVPYDLLFSLDRLAGELPDAIRKGKLPELQERFPFLRAAGFLESGQYMAFCELAKGRFTLIGSPDEGVELPLTEQALASQSLPSAGKVIVISQDTAAGWVLQQLKAHRKYFAWQSIEASGLSLKLGDILFVASHEGLTPLSAEAQLILKQFRNGLIRWGNPTDAAKAISQEQWQTLLDELFTPILERVEYQVTWIDNRPKIQLSLPAGEHFFLDVPVDPGLRGVLWMALKGNPIVWVAESSNSSKAREALTKAVIDLEKRIYVIISCPTDAYNDPHLREQWNGRVKALRSKIEELGLPIEIVDLSNLPGEEAVAKTQELLRQGQAQVLGFLHVASSNAFEVGQGGRLDKEKIKAAGPPIMGDNNKIIYGCSSLLYGLNDALVESELTSLTLTVGEELEIGEVLGNISYMIEKWDELKEQGKRQAQIDDLCPDDEKKAEMGRAEPVVKLS